MDTPHAVHCILHTASVPEESVICVLFLPILTSYHSALLLPFRSESHRWLILSICGPFVWLLQQQERGKRKEERKGSPLMNEQRGRETADDALHLHTNQWLSTRSPLLSRAKAQLAKVV